MEKKKRKKRKSKEAPREALTIVKLPSVKGTVEAIYVSSLKWEYDGFNFHCKAIPDPIKEKLYAIFQGWGIGYDGDTEGCKKGFLNINVCRSQFKRVEFSLDWARVTLTHGATNDDQRPIER